MIILSQNNMAAGWKPHLQNASIHHALFIVILNFSIKKIQYLMPIYKSNFKWLTIIYAFSCECWLLCFWSASLTASLKSAWVRNIFLPLFFLSGLHYTSSYLEGVVAAMQPVLHWGFPHATFIKPKLRFKLGYFLKIFVKLCWPPSPTRHSIVFVSVPSHWSFPTTSMWF